MEWWVPIVRQLVIPALATVLTPILVMFARRGIDALERWAEIDISDRRERRVAQIVDDAIHYAEEQARKRMKNGGDTPEGTEKLDEALGYARRRAEEAGLEDVVGKASDRLSERIEAKLFRRRLENNGGGGETPISGLALPGGVESKLRSAGIRTVSDLLDRDVDDLTDIEGIGPSSKQAVLDALASEAR